MCKKYSSQRSGIFNKLSERHPTHHMKFNDKQTKITSHFSYFEPTLFCFALVIESTLQP